jgi:hypothetical protein
MHARRARGAFFTQWIIALAPLIGGEMAHWGTRTRQICTFPVNRENISPAQNAGLGKGPGPAQNAGLHKKGFPG